MSTGAGEEDGSASASSTCRLNGRWQGSQASKDTASENSEALTDLPLTFGEQLVLETYLRCRQRPYNRQRQDELSQPRHRPGNGAMEEPGSAAAKLDKSQVEVLLSRLAQPRRHPPLAKSSDQAEVPEETKVLRRTAAEMEAISQRLHTRQHTRPLSPAEGDRIIMLHNFRNEGRSVDFQRLALMAKPRKRF